MFFLRRPNAVGLVAEDAVRGAREGTVTMIDVREKAEVATSGKAKGALLIPLNRLKDLADPQHPDHPEPLSLNGQVGIYCASGRRSQSATKTLKNLGYTDVHNIGGLSHWVQAGGSTEPL